MEFSKKSDTIGCGMKSCTRLCKKQKIYNFKFLSRYTLFALAERLYLQVNYKMNSITVL